MSEHLRGVGGAQRHLYFFRPRATSLADAHALSPVTTRDYGDSSYRSQATQTVLRDSEVQTDPILLRMTGWRMLTCRGSHRRYQSLPLSSNPFALNYSEFDNETEEWTCRPDSHEPILVRHVASGTNPKTKKHWPADPCERWSGAAVRLEREAADCESHLREILSRLQCKLNSRDERQLEKIRKEKDRALNRLSRQKEMSEREQSTMGCGRKEKGNLASLSSSLSWKRGHYSLPEAEVQFSDLQISMSAPQVQTRKTRHQERNLASALNRLLDN